MTATPQDRLLPAYGNNVFLSYGHVDNADGWVTKLHALLEMRIAQLLGLRSGGVWRDPALNAGETLWPTIEPEVESSAIFISILSPRYLKSDACLREAQKFLDHAEKSGGLIVDKQSRWLRVVKTPYPVDQEPAFFQKQIETITLAFYKEIPQSGGKFREFPAQETRPGYEDFAELAEQLAQAAVGLLQRMQRQAPKTAPGRPRVFLADTTSDRQADRAFVAAELSVDYDVAPVQPLAITTLEDLEAQTTKLLTDRVLAIHMFGSRFGATPEGEKTRSVPQIEFECAASTRRLVWIPDELGAVEERQSAFVAGLESLKGGSVEVVKSGRQKFLQHVRDTLAELTKPRETPALGKSVYLVSDEKDLSRRQLLDLANCLRQHGIMVDQPSFAGDPEALRQEEAQSLLDADATVIYFGDALDSWVKARRRQILKALGDLNRVGHHLRAVYLCSPETPVKRGVYFSVPDHQLAEAGGPSLWILGDCTDFDCGKMAPLFETLTAKKNG